MIGRPASAYGSAAATAARDGSLRHRHHGRLRQTSPRSAHRRAPPSTSASELREAFLHLRCAARSPPTETLPVASAAREDIRRPRFHGMDRSPSPPSLPASASAAREDLHPLRFHGMGLSPSPPLRPASASAARVALGRAIGGMVSISSTQAVLQRRRPCREVQSPPPPSLPRGELSAAFASATRDPLDRAIRGTGLSRTTQEALDRAIRGTGLSPNTQEALRLRHPCCGQLPSESASSARDVLRRTPTASPAPLCLSGLLASRICSPLRPQHPETSIGTLRASIALLSPVRPSREEISGPVLIVTNPEFSGSTFFSPYSMMAFTRSNFPIDTMDVLYSDGDFFLLKEGTNIRVWEIRSETSLFTFHLGVEIEQGYFSGTPSSDFTLVLGRQRVFAEQIDNVGDEEHGGQDIVAEFWLRTSDGAWQQNAVVCAHLGLHSLIIHDESLFWLSDDGCLCSLRQTKDGLLLVEWEGAVESIDSSFALVQHLNNLYIVKSGGILPNAAGIYRVVPGDPPAFPETRINGTDVFIVHGKTGFLLPNQSNDSRVFTGPLIEAADCARFSYTQNLHENIRPCPSLIFQHWCSAAWAVI